MEMVSNVGREVYTLVSVNFAAKYRGLEVTIKWEIMEKRNVVWRCKIVIESPHSSQFYWSLPCRRLIETRSMLCDNAISMKLNTVGWKIQSFRDCREKSRMQFRFTSYKSCFQHINYNNVTSFEFSWINQPWMRNYDILLQNSFIFWACF